MAEKVALITGGNTGIGLALAERLLSSNENIRICLACRNVSKAKAAQSALEAARTPHRVDIVQMDTSSIQSVLKAVKEIKSKYKRIDFLFLNAGIMPVNGVDWDNFWRDLFSSNVARMFATGEGLLKQVDDVTPDGYQQVFATNVFGHFLLVRHLADIMGNEAPSQIIWTSSSNASRGAFTLTDVQHRQGSEPYSASKYCADLLSIAMNEVYREKNIYVHTCCPGLVMTQLTYGILPKWFWYVIMPIMMLIRLFTPTMNIDAYNGAEALIWLTEHPNPASLSPTVKFCSRVDVLGRRYVGQQRLDASKEDVGQTFQIIEDMAIKAERTVNR